MVTFDYCKKRFNMTKEEYEDFYLWYNKIIKSNKLTPLSFGAIGGELTFKITPTSLGEIIVAEFMNKTYTIKDL